MYMYSYICMDHGGDGGEGLAGVLQREGLEPRGRHPLQQRLHWLLRLPVMDLRERVSIDNLLVRIHFVIVMIRLTGLAPWEL